MTDSRSDAPLLPPSCRPAAEQDTASLIVLLGEIAGRYARWNTEVLHERYMEVRGELLKRSATLSETGAPRQLALEELFSRVQDGAELIREGQYTIERAWHMATAQAERIKHAAPQVSVRTQNPPGEHPGSGPAESASRCVAGASIPDEFSTLAKFYNVDSMAALIRIQSEHVERLQKKLPPIPDQFPRTPREG